MYSISYQCAIQTLYGVELPDTVILCKANTTATLVHPHQFYSVGLTPILQGFRAIDEHENDSLSTVHHEEEDHSIFLEE